MTLRVRIAMAGITALFFSSGVFAQLVVGRSTATVHVITVPPNSTARFVFAGVTAGTISSGESIEVTGLMDGEHDVTQLDPGPNFVLTAISCNDQGGDSPSAGNVATLSAVFNLSQGESVTCTFTNTASESVSQSSSAVATGAIGQGVNPFENPDDEFGDFPVPGNLPPQAGTFTVPRAGPWSVQNHPGQMNCSGITMPLSAARGAGELRVLDDGRTVIGTGFSDGTAQLRMASVSGITGRYAGNVGGEQDGIPMIINFRWQLVTDEWIIGYLTSTVSQQGMVCNMFRTFELEYAGP